MLIKYQQITHLSLIFFASQSLIFANPVKALDVSIAQMRSPKLELAQVSEGEMMLDQMNESMSSALEEIPTFIDALSNMEAASQDQQELATLLEELIPMVSRITGNFAQAYQLGEQVNTMIPPDSQEAMIMNQLQTINESGVGTFAAWVDVLTPMQEALYSQDTEQLQSIVAQLPDVINQTIEFMDGIQSMVDSYDNSNANSSPSNNNQMNSRNVNNGFDMSGKMQEIQMNILNNI